jgi:mRNA-degrading endonuclease RelE of RelBE toxin-antitoxin system
MIILYADEFAKQFRKLPEKTQSAFRTQESIFRKDWRDPRLRIKKLKGHRFSFSFRVTRNYRVLFVFVEDDTALFATIGDRKNVYR